MESKNQTYMQPKKSKAKLISIIIIAIFLVVALVIAVSYRSPLLTPTPTPYSSASILSHSSYMSGGYLHVVGEVKNTGSTNLEFIKITATFYDSANNVIATSFTFTMIDILLPNQKSPFELSTFPYSGPVDHYSLSISYYRTSSIPYRDLQVQGVTTSNIYGYFHVLGEVKNIGSSPTTFTKVIITFYDADGKVIGATFTFTDPYDLSPGQTAPFKASTYPQTIQPASYETQVQARRA